MSSVARSLRSPRTPEHAIPYADFIATLADSANETTAFDELTAAQLASVLRAHPGILAEILDDELIGDVIEDLLEQRAFFRAAPLIGAGILGRLEACAQRRLHADVSAELARRAAA